MSLRRRGGGDALNPWPGYVDALSTLLMVVIFVLLVFVLAQAFLSVALTGKDRALDRLNRQMAELADMLSLERSHGGELSVAVAGLTRDLKAAALVRDQFADQVGDLQRRLTDGAARQDALASERDRLAAQLADTALQAQSAAGRSELAGQDTAQTAAQLADAKRQLAAAQAELARTVAADRSTLEARLADLARLGEQAAALTALRDELQAQIRDAAARAAAEAQAREAVVTQLGDEQKLAEGARAQIALMTRQLTELRTQLAQLSTALDLSNKAAGDKDVQIANLGARLNSALASKVEELQHYRSEFFGRLRDVLANRPGVQVVGDRFVFQSEVLFPPGSADMTQAGQDQMRALATTLKGLAREIPADIPWIMRVDGHADRTPTGRGPFTTNWELSSARAITVVKLLAGEGVAASHLAATGFAEFQPLDAADTPDAYARNRRIELRLTDR